MFAPSSTNLTPSRPVTLTAVVTDPDGIDDVIGGSLRDPETGGVYGPLSAAATEGVYTLTLNFENVSAVRPLEFGPGGTTRSFAATIFDAAGHETTAAISLNIRCEPDDWAACDGRCVDLQSDDENCGTCGRTLGSGAFCADGEPTCPDSSCFEGDRCVFAGSETHCRLCGNSCVAGASCSRVNGFGENYCQAEAAFANATRDCEVECAGLGLECLNFGIVEYRDALGRRTTIALACGTQGIAVLRSDETYERTVCKCIEAAYGS